MRARISDRILGDVTIVDVDIRSFTPGVGIEGLREAIGSLVGVNRTTLVLNLVGLPYVDSSGISDLLSSLETISHAGGRMKLLVLNTQLQQLFRFNSKLNTLFEVFDDEEKAVRSFDEPPRSS